MYVAQYGFYTNVLFTYVSIVLANPLVSLNKCTCTKFDGDLGFRTVIVIQLCTSTNPDRTHSLGQPWYFIGNIVVVSTLTNDVGSMSFCSSNQHYCQMLVQPPQPKKPCTCQRTANHFLSNHACIRLKLVKYDLLVIPI